MAVPEVGIAAPTCEALSIGDGFFGRRIFRLTEWQSRELFEAKLLICATIAKMRYLSPEEEFRLTRLAKVRERQRIARKNRKVRKSDRLLAVAEVQKAFALHHSVPRPLQHARIPIMVPEVFSLRDNHQETVQTVKTLRDIVLLGREPVQLYFDKLKLLEPAAALLLVAEIFRCRQLRKWRGGHTVLGNYPVDRDIFFKLRELGFFRLLSIDGHEAVVDTRPAMPRPNYLRFQTMSSVHPELAATFCDLVSQGAFAMSILARNRMTAALKEAMGNAHEHAYKLTGEYDVMKKRWWLAGHLDPEKREMMVMILDQGVGIPRTLEPTTFEQIKALLQRAAGPTDGNMIAAATELHRTSTGQGGRGRGFQDMKSFINSCDDGELRVLSNGGSYVYTKDKQSIVDYDASIGGTLVEWRVKHTGQPVEVSDD